MSDFEEGVVVVVSSGQAGTIVEVNGRDIWALLRNNDIWVGPMNQIRLPQGEEDLAACPIDVERLEKKFVPNMEERD
jgi:hypothetical protein